MATLILRKNTPVIAPGEKKGKTENGTVERILRSGKVKVGFSDGSYGVFARDVLKPFRKASREDRKEAKQESARSTRRSKMTDAEKAEAIKIFDELTGHKDPVKKDTELAGAKASTAYARALEVMYGNREKQLAVYRSINWAMGNLYKGKAVIVNHLGKLIASRDVMPTQDDVMKFGAMLAEKGKPPRYILNGMTPDAIAMQVTIAVINS